MSKKIIGVTVGTALPKPNFDQTDPKKGDYIKGDRSFLNAIKTINGVGPDSNGDFVIAVDDTLTQAGVAADAKVVGESIEAVNNLVGDVPVATQIADAITAIPQADWNQNDENATDYVKNRTHYEDVVLVDAGNDFEPTVFIPFNTTDVLTSATNGGMVKVSDLTPEVSALVETGVAKKISVAANGSSAELKYQVKITEESEYGTTLTYYNNRSNWYGSIAIVYEPGHSVCSNYDRKGLPSTDYFAVLNEPGIYFRYTERDSVKDSMSLHKLTWNEVRQLDEKYIPSTIARVSDLADAVTIDPTLTIEGAAADAKTVGDLWNSLPTDADVWETLIAIGMYERIADETGAVLTDEAGNVLLLEGGR